MKRLVLSLMFMCFCCLVNGKTIKTVGPQKPVDVSHDFFMNVLQKSLRLAYPDDVLEIEATTHPGQARVIKLMQQGGYYDIVWSANTDERNQSLLPVEFPLLGGGLGLRGLVIQASRLAEFEGMTSLEDFKPLVVCQGRNWPDAAILRDAGLNVYEVSHFDAMLSMVELGRCDVMPLSVYEGYSELNAVSSDFPSLIFFTDVVLQYDLVMNFYVHPDKTDLQQALLPALVELHNTGEYTEILATHELTRMTNERWQARGHRIISIKTTRTLSTLAQRDYFSDLVLMSK